MGPRQVTYRVVVDTNVVVSALVFRAGRVSWLRSAWSSGAVIPVVSESTVTELLRVLAYPKFGLSEDDIDELLADLSADEAGAAVLVIDRILERKAA